MNLDEALLQKAKDTVSITDLIGSGDDIRMWPVMLPKNLDFSISGNFPAITYTRIVNLPHHVIPLDIVRIQMSVWAQTYVSGRELVGVLVETYQGMKEIIGSTPTACLILAGIHANDLVLREPDIGLFHFPVDFRFKHWKEVQ